jgi:hypothetical protein
MMADIIWRLVYLYLVGVEFMVAYDGAIEALVDLA